MTTRNLIPTQRRPILICPLDWGLGHASRMTPLISAMLALGQRVVIAADGQAMLFLQQEFFQQVEYIHLPGKRVQYARGPAFFRKLVLQLPGLVFSIGQEHLRLKSIINQLKPLLVISDNRYGLWSRKTYSVFITHQLFIQLPPAWKWLEPLVRKTNHAFIQQFDECWVPDYAETPNLSGRLSHGSCRLRLRYLGALSRFSKVETFPHNAIPDPKKAGKYILVMLSGPEPQRTILEKKLQQELQTYSVIWLQGKPDASVSQQHISSQRWISHTTTHHLGRLIQNAELVIARSGYSTLMDLSVFGKKAVFIPTPGQTEQEYLAIEMQRQNYVIALAQNQLAHLPEAIKKALELSGLPVLQNRKNYESILKETLAKLEKNAQ